MLTSLFVTALLAASTSAYCNHRTTSHDEYLGNLRSSRSLVGRQVGAQYTYDGVTGPLNWAALEPELNELCHNGTEQSPINVPAANVRSEAGTGYTLTLPATTTSVLNNTGHNVEVEAHAGSISIPAYGGAPAKTFNLAQFHFHTPSEHRFNQEYYPMEAHFVFQAADKSLAVVGFPIALAATNGPLFNTVLAKVASIPNKGNNVATGPLNFTTLVTSFRNNNVYRYAGSLTTPPCDEGVQWILSSAPIGLTLDIYNAAKKVIKFNSRYSQNVPLQPNLLTVACQ